MADYQRTIELLRDFRASPAQQVTDELRQCAAEYAELCQKANERLRQCSTFLQQGLRSEAIQFAEQPPNLLDLVAALDMPDAAEWIEFCQQQEMAVPPLIMIERAAQLNDAYAQDGPLEQVLRRVRRLALAQAPVRERLEAMRQAAALDAGSSFWDKDLRTFEQARLRELRHGLALAMNNRDNAATAALAREVVETQWLETVPDDLRNAAGEVQQTVKRELVDQKLQAILAQLHTAFQARDAGKCATLLAECKGLSADFGSLHLSKQSATEMKRVAAWVAAEQEAENQRQALADACSALTAALDVHAPEAQLEPAYMKLKALGQPVPPDLEQRYHAIVGRRAKESQRRFWITVSSIAGAILVGLFGFYLYFQSNLAEGWAKKINAAIAARDLPRARSLAEAQEKRAPQFSATPVIVAAKKELANLQAAYDHDSAAIKQLLEQLAKAQTEVAATDANKSADLDALGTAMMTLSAASQSCQGGADPAWVDAQGQLAAASKRLNDLAGSIGTKIAQGVTAKVSSLEREADALTNDPGADLSAATAKLDQLAEQLQGLRQRVPMGENTRMALDAAIGRFDGRRQALAQSQDQAQALRNLRRGELSPDERLEAMQAFVKRFPTATASQDFAKVLASAEGPKSIDAWQKLSGQWANELAPTTSAVAEQRIKAIQAYVADHPKSPYAPAANAYIQYLAQAAGVLAVNNAWQAALKELLSSPLITDLKYLAASDGRRYYVMGDPKVQQSTRNEDVFYSFEVIDPSNLTKRRPVKIGPKVKLLSDKPQPLPHSRFAQALSSDIKLIDSAHWDSFGITAVDKLVKDAEVDIVPKAILLQEILKANQKFIGWGIGSTYDTAIESLARQNAANLIWYDQDHPVSQLDAQALQTIIDRLPKTEAVLGELSARRTALFKSVTCSLLGTGMLYRENGIWAIATDAPPTEGAVALAAGPAPAGEGAAPLLRVAQVKDGKYVFDPAAVADLPQGTVVFLAKP